MYKRGSLQDVLLCFAGLQLAFGLKFSAVTSHVRLQDVAGRIEAYADFNADKATDVFVVNTTGTVHSIYIWNSKKHHFWENEIKLDLPSELAALRTADFDGDGVVDLLTLSKEEREGSCFTATVHWCALEGGRVHVENSTTIASLIKAPVVVDSNGDHLPDVFAISCRDDHPRLWTSRGERRWFNETVLQSDREEKPLDYYTSSYFVDLNSDCMADVVIDGGNRSGRVLEVWLKSNTGRFSYHGRTLLPRPVRELHTAGKLAFADMDGDGVLEAVVLGCEDSSCNHSFAYILHQMKFPGTNVLHCHASNSWTLTWTHVISVALAPGKLYPQAVVDHTPIVGDVNLDNRPDIVTVASSNKTKTTGFQPLLLLGSPCRSDCNGSSVTVQPSWELFGGAQNVTSASFFDIGEDGVLDVLLVQENGVRLHVYRQNIMGDHAFLKVLVLSGYCFAHCKSGIEPYGSVLPGAVATFSTTDRNGRREKSVAVIHAGATLQLPFIVFGLGDTPNFIEDLTVGMDGGRGTVYHQWSSLVPNSQLIVIPAQPDNPSRWRLELYLTPSHLVYNTAAVLTGLAVAIAILIGLLQVRERYQDSKERRQAKHRFHFNAM